MTSADLEQTLAALEAEVATLKLRPEAAGVEQQPWWKNISGIFADDPAFEEAMKLGREWRESFRPKPPRKKKNDGRSRHRSPEPPRKTGVRSKPRPSNPTGSS
jgi:hypothetical protein